MRGFATTTKVFAAVLLIASRVANVIGCAQDSDCNCVSRLCQDETGTIFAGTTCTLSEQCLCFNTSEGGFCTVDLDATSSPTKSPSQAPSQAPTNPSPPSKSPTKAPSSEPSAAPTKAPSPSPTKAPSVAPSQVPTKSPTDQPTTLNPTKSPSDSPSKAPTTKPTGSPSQPPTANPTNSPTDQPSKAPTAKPTTKSPTDQPTTLNPTISPTGQPSRGPSAQPTTKPSTAQPTIARNPTNSPTGAPSQRPTESPTDGPTKDPTKEPSEAPSLRPSKAPSNLPTKEPTKNPTEAPSRRPSDAPTVKPTNRPTDEPTGMPVCPIFPTCDEPERECGWGIWNVWTCQCDCAPGFCLSANQECYDGCTTRLDFNPFGGCAPGCDCPWYPDPSGGTHCVTTVNFAGIYNIHRTAEQCCERHFSYLSIGTCVSDSEQSVDTARVTTAENARRPTYYYPDIFGRDNCIYHNGYYDWMMDSYSELYLFTEDVDCCSMWYPARTDCPDLSDPTERDVNEKPYPVRPYFYPHESESNCRFGRNYPQWMAQTLYLQDHLYTTPEECCTNWYPAAGDNCPLGPDDGVQDGSYWLSDVAFYPNWKGNWCNFGDDYPEWMADPINKDGHLFDSALACCQTWYSEQVLECQNNVVTSNSGSRIDGEQESGEWYPTLAWPFECKDDGNVPSWMEQQGYKQYYVFSGQAECCKAHYCSSLSSLFGT